MKSPLFYSLRSRASGLLLSIQPLLLLNWLEQFGSWVMASGVDWSRLPWAFGGATIATLKAKRDPEGNVIHKSFFEWLSIAVSGTFIAMAGWKDVEKLTGLSPELSTVTAGLIGWILADIIIKQAKKQLAKSDDLPKP